MKNTPSFCSFIKKLYLCSKMSCTSMQITQVCRNQNSCQLITSFLNFPHKLFILSGLWDYSKYRYYLRIGERLLQDKGVWQRIGYSLKRPVSYLQPFWTFCSSRAKWKGRCCRFWSGPELCTAGDAGTWRQGRSGKWRGVLQWIYTLLSYWDCINLPHVEIQSFWFVSNIGVSAEWA